MYVLLISISVAAIIAFVAYLFLFVIDILYSLYKSKKTGKKQYWIVDVRYGCKQVNSMKEIVVYRLEIGLFTIVISLLIYVGLLIYIKV